MVSVSAWLSKCLNFCLVCDGDGEKTKPQQKKWNKKKKSLMKLLYTADWYDFEQQQKNEPIKKN